MTYYSWLLGLAAAAGLALSGWIAAPEWERPTVESGALLVLGTVLGGRADYILRHWSFYREHLIEALNPGAGGLAWPGAVMGALLFFLVYALTSRTSIPDLADHLLPLAAFLVVAAWLGCWMAGCAYGLQTTGLALPAVDESGAVTGRFPLQLPGVLLGLAGFGLAEWLQTRRVQPGLPAFVAAFVNLGVLFGVSFYQADPGRFWYGWRFDAWAALIFIGLALLGLLYLLIGTPDET